MKKLIMVAAVIFSTAVSFCIQNNNAKPAQSIIKIWGNDTQSVNLDQANGNKNDLGQADA